ncbi:MAG: BatA domain-containing protein [Pirellulales bacterium]
MTFLQPWLLIGLPLAALPIIIHLINLRRHRKVEWGAMMFLLAAQRQRRGHTRLRHFLILASRVLAVLALMFVISRPIAGRWFGILAGQPDTVLVLLDRSASMSQQDVQTGVTKRSVAVEQIASALERAGAPRNLVLIESTGRQPAVLSGPSALREVPEAGATDASANVAGMLQSALDYITANNAGRTDIWICSDLQASDWNAEGGRWAALRSSFQEMKQPVRFHLLTYADPAPDNLSVRVTSLRRDKTSDGDRLVMDIKVQRPQGGAPQQLPVTIEVDGSRSVVDIELAGDSFVLADHLVPIDAQRKSGWGKVELPQDGNPRDNVYYFSYGDTAQQRTVVVSDEAGAAWPLELAAGPQREQGAAAVKVISSGELDGVEWDKLSLLLWQAELPSGDVAKQIEKFVQRGGNVIFFPHSAEDNGSIFGMRWGAWDRVAADADPVVESWRDDAGLLAHSAAGQPLPVNLLAVQDFRQLEGNGQVLARLAGGAPLVTRVPTDRGAVYFVTTLAQEPYSSLARDGVVFFVMIQRALRDGAAPLYDAQFGEIGKTAWKHDSSPNAPEVLAVDAWPEGTLTSEQPFVAGVYRQVEDDWQARNRPVSEDQIAVLRNDQLESLFAGLNYRIVRDTMQTTRSLVSEIWRVFAATLILALILECVLCLPEVQPMKPVSA